jgi:hypothetical protein
MRGTTPFCRERCAVRTPGPATGGNSFRDCHDRPMAGCRFNTMNMRMQAQVLSPGIDRQHKGAFKK